MRQLLRFFQVLGICYSDQGSVRIPKLKERQREKARGELDHRKAFY